MYRLMAESLVKYLEELREFLAELAAGRTTVDQTPEKPANVNGKRCEVFRSGLNKYALMSREWDRLRPVYKLALKTYDKALEHYVIYQCLHHFNSDDKLRANKYV